MHRGWELKVLGEVVLVEGVRTAIGRFGGSLRDLAASDLGAAVIREVLERTQVPHEVIGDVIFGCVGQVAEDAYIARTSAIKGVLRDQNLVSGIGNIYADESLWAARIHPETIAADLSTRAVNRLLAEVRLVLQKALAEGGTSFDAQYVNVNGQAGYFAHSLNAYGRT